MARRKLQTIQRTTRGLWSQHNPVTGVPEGALVRAENAVCDREGIVGKRRGVDRYGAVHTAAPDGFFSYKDLLHFFVSGKVVYDDSGDGSSWTTLDRTGNAPFTEAESMRFKAAEARRSVFFGTDEGVFAIESAGAKPHPAGIVQALEPELSLTATGWFNPDGQVAYKIVFVYSDANGREIRSAPSPRSVIVNPAGGSAQDVLIKTKKPKPHSGFSPEGDYEIYRTQQSADESTDPGEEYFLVSRLNYGTIEETTTNSDTLPDDFLGEPLYTNPTIDGAAQENREAPIAADLAWYRYHMFFARCKRDAEIKIQFKDETGITDGTDTITLDNGTVSRVYTFATANDFTLREFKRETGGTAAENVRDTMRNFVQAVNRDPADESSGFFAYYTSGALDAPGIVLIRTRDRTEQSFTVESTVGTKFEPSISSAVNSEQEDDPSLLYRSRRDRPEAVPDANTVPVGSSDSPILRILAIRDSLIILKDEGIYRLSGESEASFDVEPLDPTVRCIAPDTAVVLNNAVYALTNQGVVRINEAGSVIVSRQIEPDIDRIITYTGFDTKSFAVADEAGEHYQLWVPSSSSDAHPTECYVYNYLSLGQAGKWSGPWLKDAKHGYVIPETRVLYLSHALDKFVLKERKDRALSDYSDESITVGNANVDTVSTTTNEDGDTVTTVTLDWTYSNFSMQEGFLLKDLTSADEAKVRKVTDNGSNSYTLELDAEYPSMAATNDMQLSIPIISDVEWTPDAADNPGLLKQFSYISLYPEQNDAERLELSIATDEVPTFENLGAFKITAGTATRPLSTIVPRQHQTCRALSVRLKHRYAKERFDLLSLNLTFRSIGERVALQR